MSWTAPRSVIVLVFLVLAPALGWGQSATLLRDLATVRLTFDEPDGPALDSALTGSSQDAGQLQNGPARVPSPFWNATGTALQLDAARQQFVEVPDSADVDRPDALTFSLFAVNLQEPTDGAYHGLVAKRGTQDGKIYTNYGINFTMQADNFQVYLSDGSGYRVVQYSTKAAFPTRKLLHVTTTYQVGDAPGADADTDADDVRIQYFVNGQPIAPKSVTQGFVNGNEAWITDVNPAGLVNNLPVSIGRSEVNGEYFAGVVDDFVLLPKALTPEEVRQLFLEMAGSNVDELIKQDTAAPPALPEIARVSHPGFTIGQATEFNLFGKNLAATPQVFVPAEGVRAELIGDAADDRLRVKLTVDAGVRPSTYPLYVRTERGISSPQPIAIDVLPHVAAANASVEKPANLPAAVFGTLAGGQEPRAYFQGTKGQRFVADLELRRLGGKANPVLELKNSAHTPVKIAWGTPSLAGDVRLEATLPADGMYYVELHDLVYRAPGPNEYRLKLGDLTLVDLPFPVAGGAGDFQYEPVGVGTAPGIHWAQVLTAEPNTTLLPISFPPESHIVGPWPVVKLSAATEVVESTPAAGQRQTVDALFTDPAAPVLAINGRLLQSGETDTYVLNVAPGQSLRLALESQSLKSPIAGELEILNDADGRRLAISGDQPSDVDPSLDIAIPGDVQRLRVTVRDLLHGGSPRAVYRLTVAPVGRPDFRLACTTSTVQLPAGGSTFLELTVTRQGYDGPIALSAVGAAEITVSPAEIPTGVQGTVLCRLVRTSDAGGTVPLFKIAGTIPGSQPLLTRYALRGDTAVLPEYTDAIACGTTAPSGLSMQIVNPPAQLFKGVPCPLQLQLQRAGDQQAASLPIRITSRSTEKPRPRDPNKPAEGSLPAVSIAPATMIPAGTETASVRLNVPLDVAEPVLMLAAIAEALPHAYSERIVATAVAEPFRATVQAAVAPKLSAGNFTVTSESTGSITAELQRTAGFTHPVQATLIGLPAGYQAPAVTIAGDQNAFELKVTAPAVAAEAPLAGVKLRLTVDGSQIAPDQDVALKAVPKT